MPIERLVAYYGKALGGAHLPFNFQLILTAWNAATVARLIEEYEKAIPPGGWPNWVLSNHDQPRVAARVGDAQARVAAMLLLTLRGTPTIYYADELGLARVAIPSEATQDPWEKNEPGLGLNRDPSRTPMQWDGSPNAGFTNGARPWLPLDADYRAQNVESLRGDPRSPLSLYRALIQLRRGHLALSVGTFRLLASNAHTLIYERKFREERIVVALNFSGAPQALPEKFAVARLLLTTHFDRDGPLGEPTLRGNEGVIMSGA